MKGAWRDFSADMLLVLASRVGLNPTLKLAARSKRPHEELSSPKCKAQLPANRSPHALRATRYALERCWQSPDQQDAN
jgi:hypothetical protein